MRSKEDFVQESFTKIIINFVFQGNNERSFFTPTSLQKDVKKFDRVCRIKPHTNTYYMKYNSNRFFFGPVV